MITIVNKIIIILIIILCLVLFFNILKKKINENFKDQKSLNIKYIIDFNSLNILKIKII